MLLVINIVINNVNLNFKHNNPYVPTLPLSPTNSNKGSVLEEGKKSKNLTEKIGSLSSRQSSISQENLGWSYLIV
jgi:hypothetical protein